MPRTKRARQGSSRNNALDGLRALAIVSVILYHLAVPWLPSGHMGVVLFLVLGGYLASSTVLRTMRREGRISLPRMWAKRVVRIWPAMATMVVFAVALCVAFDHVLLTKLRPDLVPSLLLANNLGAILRGASYFDNLGGTSPLTHLWYLGVDIQFFVVWTLVATLLCPRGRSSRAGRRCALALAVVSAVLMGVLYDPNADPTRVYYGPDTRAFAPLLGAWLGLAWPLGGKPVRLDRARHTVRSLPLLILSPLALVGLVVIMALVPDTSPFLYRGGMFLVAILCTIAIAGVLDRRSPMARIFGARPLAWLGSRSYGLYLWHFPLFQLLKVTNNATSPLTIALAAILSLAAAEASLRLVEQRVAQGRIPFVGSEGMVSQGGAARALALLPAVFLIVGLATGATGLIVVPNQTAVPDEAIKSTGAGVAEAMDLSDRKRSSTGNSATGNQTSSSDSEEEDKKTARQDPDDLPTGTITLNASSESIKEGLYTPVVIADSVAGDADWYFNQHAPDGLLDSYVGRRPDQALAVLEGYLDQGVVGNIVVLDSFSNVPASEATMEQLIESCGDRHVYLVNVRIPEVEQAQINEQLDRVANTYDNVTLIDWYEYSEGHDEWIYPDGEHLTPEGQPYYINLITNAIAKDFATDGGAPLCLGTVRRYVVLPVGRGRVHFSLYAPWKGALQWNCCSCSFLPSCPSSGLCWHFAA